MTALANPERIDAVRRFTRFYTQHIGVLGKGLLGSPFSLTEARVLYELAHCDTTTATEICMALGLDPGYLSRILRDFHKKGYIDKSQSEQDGRQSILKLTPDGEEAFASLNERSHHQIEAMLSELSREEQRILIDSMGTIEKILGSGEEGGLPYILRPHHSGDMGWIVHKHGVLYSEEFGWDETFEALCAEIVADFIHNHDPKMERCWIAEMNGENIGCVFIAKEDDQTARLRLLLVDPKARGLGLGTRLVEECIRFCRQKGYKKIVLWTRHVLEGARRIYQRAGFEIIHTEESHHYGLDLIDETWELKL